MLDALLILDNDEQVYSIFTFMALPDAKIDSYRQHLVCNQCGGKAFYRRQGIDGKSACFGSRYHRIDCDEARLSHQSVKEVDDSAEINRLIHSNKVIVLDYFTHTCRSHDTHSKALPKTHKLPNTQSPSITQEDTDELRRIESVSRLGMEKLLNSLLRGSDLAQADTLVEIDAGYLFKAKNLFVNFAYAKASDSIKTAKPKMYWGTLSHTDADMSWLNPADCQDLGIPLGRHRQLLLDRFKIKEKRDLEGAGVILFGKCFWNKDKTRKIIELWNSERVFFSLEHDQD